MYASQDKTIAFRRGAICAWIHEIAEFSYADSAIICILWLQMKSKEDKLGNWWITRYNSCPLILRRTRNLVSGFDQIMADRSAGFFPRWTTVDTTKADNSTEAPIDRRNDQRSETSRLVKLAIINLDRRIEGRWCRVRPSLIPIKFALTQNGDRLFSKK